MQQKGFSNLVIIIIVCVLVIIGAVGCFLIEIQKIPPERPPLGKTIKTSTAPTQTPISGKLPKITLTRLSPTAAGDSGISIIPTSFINKISLLKPPEDSDVYSYKTLFSSKYVAELANIFGVPFPTTKSCPSGLDCGDQNLENGVYKSRTPDGQEKYYIAYNYDERTGKYPIYRELSMVSGGDTTFVFEVQVDSPLYSLPAITDPNEAINRVKSWLKKYPQVFEDIDNWSGKYDNGVVVFSPTQPTPLYRAPYIRVTATSEKKPKPVVNPSLPNEVSFTATKIVSFDPSSQTMQVYVHPNYQEGTPGLIDRGPEGLKTITVKITPNTKITRNGQPISINDLKYLDKQRCAIDLRGLGSYDECIFATFQGFDVLGVASSVNNVTATSITREDEVIATVTWLSSHNKQISKYKLRSVEEAWKDLSSGELRGYYNQLVILDVPLSKVDSNYLAKHNGAITGTFIANEVSLAYGRWDDPHSDSPGFFLIPVYVFSGVLDIGVQKLPLKIWVPAVPYDKG
jgi:hypothetical protein